MEASWFQLAKGVVTVAIRGERQEQLVNEAIRHGISLWAIRKLASGEMECKLSVSDFFRLRAFLKRTSCRVHVTGRAGLPFLLNKLEKRKFFAAGFLLFMIGLYVLSSLVWRVDVIGNTRLSTDEVLQAAHKQGVYPFQWQFRLAGADELSRRLTHDLPEAAWIGVKREGTRIIIEVVENTRPDPKTLYSPRHLIATEDAVVTDIRAEAGRVVVSRNTKVKRGDILISGTLGNETNSQIVAAKGDVRGRVWHVYEVEVPLVQKAKVYTGNRKVKWHLYLAGRTIQVSGYGETPWARSEALKRTEQLAWRGLTLPLGRVREQVLEVAFQEVKHSVEDAKKIGLQQAEARVRDAAGGNSEVIARKLLHERTDNGKVYMKVFFEVEQSIVTEMPLVQMQGE